MPKIVEISFIFLLMIFGVYADVYPVGPDDFTDDDIALALQVLLQPWPQCSQEPKVQPVGPARAPAVPYTGVFKTFDDWTDSCRKCPKNIENAAQKRMSGFLGNKKLANSEQAWKEFETVLVAWFEMMRTRSLDKEELWHVCNQGYKKPLDEFFDLKKAAFMPYAQKLIEKQQSRFYIRGDLHGDVFSLLEQGDELKKDNIMDDEFRLTDDDTYMLFLGDVVDRGWYGAEALYTIFRWMLANPDRVVLLRGNHEDVNLNYAPYSGGFVTEIASKFGCGYKHFDERFSLITRTYEFLPVVFYLGCTDTATGVTNYLQCCHGGIEIGYDPASFLDDHSTAYQLLGALHRRRFCNNFKQHFAHAGIQDLDRWWNGHLDIVDDLKLAVPACSRGGLLGHMWTDFAVKNDKQVATAGSRGSRSIQYGQTATEKIIQFQSTALSRIFALGRAHQHDDETMPYLIQNQGVYRMWDMQGDFDTGLVWTFNVAPDLPCYQAQYGPFRNYLACLTIAESLKEWKLHKKEL
jgi:hypothetical protein